ncbi:MAG: hypothetical protein ACRC4W_02490 [Treponemataceae bacterium]
MGVQSNAVSRVTGVDVQYRNFNEGSVQFLPQRLAVVGVGNDNATYTLDKFEAINANDVAKRYGYGSPLHLVCRQLFPQNGNSATFPVTIYPVEKNQSSIFATNTVEILGSANDNFSGSVVIGGIKASFVITKNATENQIATTIATAINAVLEMPAKATVESGASIIELSAKWSGQTGNKISLQFNLQNANFAISYDPLFSGGLLDPTVKNVFPKFGQIWETFILNTFDYKGQDLLDLYQVFGEERWGLLNKKPIMVAHGCTDDYTTRTDVSDERPFDYINFFVTSVKSPELPFVVAAKAMIDDIITTANDNPPTNYKGLLKGLAVGADEYQEDYNVHNLSVQKGASTNIVNGGLCELKDIVTFYHPAEEGNIPSKRYVVDLVKLQNIVYNVRLILESDRFKGAPFVTNDDLTTNPNAFQPKDIKTALINLSDSLVDSAIIMDGRFTKKNIKVEIDSQNPKRLNVIYPVKLSGNAEIISTDLFFGFYLGE